MVDGHELTREDIEAIAVLKDAIPRMDKKIGEIFDLLDGPNGVVTKTALHDQSIGRIWWWLGSVSLAILGAAGWIIRKALS